MEREKLDEIAKEAINFIMGKVGSAHRLDVMMSEILSFIYERIGEEDNMKAAQLLQYVATKIQKEATSELANKE